VLVWQRRYERAKQSREQAEQLLQEKSRALYVANQELQTRADQLQASLEQLEAAQDALVEREKMAALGAMVAGIAHEVNTPLGVAVTGATLAQEVLVALLQRLEQGGVTRGELRREMSALQEATGLVVTNAQRAATLILSFKKVAVDQSSDALRTVRLADLLADVLVSLQPVLRRARVTHQLTVGADQLLKLDAGALTQVVTNLIQNACVHAFLPEHDQRMVAINAEVGPSDLWLSVTDNGRGMSSEVQESVFEPFFTTSRDSGGSGLGMHIVRNLVVGKFGGSIYIDSPPLQGTSWRIRIPLGTPLVRLPQGDSGICEPVDVTEHNASRQSTVTRV
jgi:signal transduction histidine kinase